MEWQRRSDAGVSVKLRGIGRVIIQGISQLDPFIQVGANEYNDEPTGDLDGLRALGEEVRALHTDCVGLQRKIDTGDTEEGAAAFDWGHERTDTSHVFRRPLDDQIAALRRVLDSGKDVDAPPAWACVSREAEDLQLLSFAAVAGFDPAVRMRALDTQDTGERMREARARLEQHRQVLAAKSALAGLDLKLE